MNRDRLKILRDHLAGLPDERVDMADWRVERPCGTVSCIGGWACEVFGGPYDRYSEVFAGSVLGLSGRQPQALFYPWEVSHNYEADYTRSDAIAAIQSMLDSPDDDALPVWPSREGASA